jgi:hypothetical protein
MMNKKNKFYNQNEKYQLRKQRSNIVDSCKDKSSNATPSKLPIASPLINSNEGYYPFKKSGT